MPWINDDMVLYHGCSEQSLQPNNPNGIAVSGAHNISHTGGAKLPDFGPGFYTTTWLHQARNWANLRVLKLQRRYPNSRAIVLSMRLSRNDFADLEVLAFPSDRDNFYPFVEYCRSGGLPHADLAFRNGPYDVITGPVTLGRQTMAIAQADQLSFHTANATSLINNVNVVEFGNPLIDVWSVRP